MLVLYAWIRRWLLYLLKFLTPPTLPAGRHPRQRDGRLVRRADQPAVRSRTKPLWVRHEILQSAAIDAHAGCRRLADIFNRRDAGEGMTIGKSFVATLLRQHASDILGCRRDLRRQRESTRTLHQVMIEKALGRPAQLRQRGRPRRSGTQPGND